MVFTVSRNDVAFSRDSTMGPVQARAIFGPTGANGLGPQAREPRSISLKPAGDMPPCCKRHPFYKRGGSSS